MRKRITSLALVLLLSLAALPAFAAVPDSITVGLVLPEGGTVDPLTTRHRDPQNLLSLVYEGLFKLDDNRQPVPCLVEDYEFTNEGKRLIITLKDDILFHDGTPLTAQDVVATLDRIWLIAGYDEDKKTEVPLEQRGVHCNLYAYINSWRLTDDGRIQINASRAYYGLLNALTFPVFPAAYLAQGLDPASPDYRLPPGTGPYQVEEYFPGGDRLWLSAWYEWHDTPPSVANLIGYFYPDGEAVLNAYESLAVDMTMSRQLATTRYSGSLNSFYLPYRTQQLETLLMHHNSSPLGSQKMRRAIAAAIDPSVLIRNVYQSMALATTTPILPGTWLYDASITGDGYNVTLANSLLSEEGWVLTDDGFRYKTIDGEPKKLSLSLITYEEVGSSVRRNTANSIQDMLAAVGIQVNVSTQSFENVQRRLEAGNFDLALAAFQMDVVPDPGYLLTSSSTNYCRYRSETMGSLITNLRKQYEEGAYYEAMREIQRQFVMDVPFLCLYYRMGALVTRYSFTSARDVREMELLRGIEAWQ